VTESGRWRWRAPEERRELIVGDDELGVCGGGGGDDGRDRVSICHVMIVALISGQAQANNTLLCKKSEITLYSFSMQLRRMSRNTECALEIQDVQKNS